ncbi:hypothetical protein [Paracoccus mutanolyticus]|uniref:hypothetical protein n=1 Tax=Paracoccus mutanolyticus TaxID=1499308 RepID=UPI0016775EC5|nr:hypothetical protein [Paracoccus mutanolyticus]
MALENTEQFYLRVIPPYPGEISSATAIATGTATIYDGTLRGTETGNLLIGSLCSVKKMDSTVDFSRRLDDALTQSEAAQS